MRLSSLGGTNYYFRIYSLLGEKKKCCMSKLDKTLSLFTNDMLFCPLFIELHFCKKSKVEIDSWILLDFLLFGIVNTKSLNILSQYNVIKCQILALLLKKNRDVK